MTTTPVGMRCPECSRERTKVVTASGLAGVPRVTYALIAVNVIAFLAEGSGVYSFGGAASGTVVEEGGLIGSSPSPAAAGIGVAHGQVWRVVTSGFLHENLLHIGFNMWVLFVLGTMLEPALGSLKFAVIYGVALLTGSFGALLVSPHVLTVGASGAIFGLMGAAVVEMRARQIPIMQSGVGALIMVNLVISFSVPGISWGGHIGGLIGGALAALVLQVADRRRMPAAGLAACLLIALAAAAGCVATANASKAETVQLTAPPTSSLPE